MSTYRALRTALTALATSLTAITAMATATPASASPSYSLTLCNYSDDFHSWVDFPYRSPAVSTPIAWTNRCVVTTHRGGETIVLRVRPDSQQNNGSWSSVAYWFTTDQSNDVYHTSGTFGNRVIRAHAHR
ncbi:hypothetical protein ACQPYE_17050 [Actinosynnema sp. CA-299493]